jgi:hypothetical protein
MNAERMETEQRLKKKPVSKEASVASVIAPLLAGTGIGAAGGAIQAPPVRRHGRRALAAVEHAQQASSNKGAEHRALIVDRVNQIRERDGLGVAHAKTVASNELKAEYGDGFSPGSVDRAWKGRNRPPWRKR